jgi:hypothetical protein
MLGAAVGQNDKSAPSPVHMLPELLLSENDYVGAGQFIESAAIEDLKLISTHVRPFAGFLGPIRLGLLKTGRELAFLVRMEFSNLQRQWLGPTTQ